MAVYKEDPTRVEQDANNELRISEGGYGNRQLFELVQNAIDAARDGGGRVAVHLTRDALYVANDGAPFTADGIRAIMASDISRKADDRIGRFGIGFKSVIAVTTNPKIISRTVSFAFDAEWASETIRDSGFLSPRYPVMRLAKTLNAAIEAAADPTLSDLMEWASTVVVLPLRAAKPRQIASLSTQLVSFPPEFALFSPHVTQATLIDETKIDAGVPGSLEIAQQLNADGTVTLSTGSSETRWILVSRKHNPSVSSQEEAGRIARRESVDVQWAVSTTPSGRSNDGQFWAYFPTKARTTLSGIVNAPWKLSDDRLDLLAGSFNEEILRREVPALLAEGIALLHTTLATTGGTPGAILDVLPARGRETRGWADGIIGGVGPDNPVFTYLRTVASVPDGAGRLQSPRLLLRAPAGTSPEWIRPWNDWLEIWGAVSSAPAAAWVHPDAYSNQERRLKLERLSLEPSTAATWLEALVGDGSVESSAQAIDLAATMLSDLGSVREPQGVAELRREIAKARIIKLEDGSLARAASGKLFVRTSPEDVGHAFVDPELARSQGVLNGLAKLGVHVLDAAGALRALLAESHRPDGHWLRIWEAARQVPTSVAGSLFREYLEAPLEKSVRVRTSASAMRSIAETFLPGEIIPANGQRDRDRLIDPVFHAADRELLEDLGAVDKLVWRHAPPPETWVSAYIAQQRNSFVEQIEKSTGTRPATEKVLVDGPPPPWPMAPLESMSPEARLAATRQIIGRPLPEKWSVAHSTSRNYQQFKADAPELSFIRKFGLLETSFGPMRPRHTISVEAHPALDSLVLPVFETSSKVAEALRLINDIEEVTPETWGGWKAVADQWEDDDRRAEFYAWLPGRFVAEELVVRVGTRRESVAIEHIGVTSDRAVYASMIEAGVPGLWVQETSDVDQQFIGNWGMPNGKDLLEEEIVVEEAGEAAYLIDLFPPLKVLLAAEAPDAMDVRIQPCSQVVKMLATPEGQRAVPIKFRRDGDVVVVTAPDPFGQLSQASEALNLGLQPQQINKIFDDMARSTANRRRHEVKTAKDDDERLVRAVGVMALRRIVPVQALEALGADQGALDDRGIAALARAVHGVGILKQLRSALDEAGLEPPKEWSGRRITRQWIASLGFPPDWAGFPNAERPAVEIIDGPVELGGLHPYQVEVTRKITALLRGIGPDRGMVSLPTGAGKTRVTVQALVDAARDGDISFDAPLVWIAQTDELCEQAAETWAEVWRVLGPRLPMRLGRLWATREVDEEPGGFQLIIATISKLDSITKRVSDEEYAWLRSPSVVVIDEAHTSVATSYTTVLDWLGRTGRGRKAEERRPLIGLTATPFRGSSLYETDRLAKRYDNNRLDRGAFRNDDDAYGELQDAKVLARVRHELIDGVDVRLSENELSSMAQYGGGRLPANVETRLGEQLDRTRRIADHIAKQPDDWTMLAFTPSVENARVLAALLSHRGIAAVSVSAETDPAARRYYIGEFKAGRIRVITNYNILTQGFDAPKVRAVYVARPTFSPNVYQQMVGRGLRGRKNGGHDEVLIVNVDDNFTNYGEKLAFTEFEYLWNDS